MVKWFNGVKGFGFIALDVGGKDLFVHQTSIRSNGFRIPIESDAKGAEVVKHNNGPRPSTSWTPMDPPSPPMAEAEGGNTLAIERGNTSAQAQQWSKTVNVMDPHGSTISSYGGGGRREYFGDREREYYGGRGRGAEDMVTKDMIGVMEAATAAMGTREGGVGQR
ncbi:hypothetical protein COCNU_11G008080 [Cocos nucifera]|uniref:CSD domain-containing protein n=1 Tax=Cocos nucifera TaxID=13894 RepID=A0A8K0N915_COCNU|nr:hypothetical protein COCNU_11G008080 [Cocos nucifera]